MKRKLINLTALLFLIYIIMFNNVIAGYFLKYLNVINLVFFGLLSFFAYKNVGFIRDNKLINYNVMQTTIISFIIYYFLTYVLGLFFGFVANAYSLTLINIIKNVILVGIYYLFREMYRYMFIKKNNNKISCVVITLLFILLDIIMEVNAYELSSGIGIFKFVCDSVVSNIAINVLISYVSYNFNLKNTINLVYILKLPIYFIPIFPDLGNYLNSVLLIVLIFSLYYQFSLIIEKYERKINNKIYKRRDFSLLFVISLMLCLVGLISGLFKFHLFAIMSNSMVPVFSRGDAVLVEKLGEDELNELKKGDIVAFRSSDNRMIVHRIVSIDVDNGKYYIKTKGDNNEAIDSWSVNNENIYGKVLFSIKYIGLPSVELSDLMSR